MTLLKDNNYKDINIALLSLEADIKKLGNNSAIASQLADINKRIDEINKGGSTDGSDEIKAIKNDIIAINSDITSIETDITNINTNIDNIEQQLSNIFTAENRVTDFNATTNSGIYYWTVEAANRPSDYGVLLVNKFAGVSGSIWINQTAYGTNNKIYFRQNINSGNWTEWKAVAFEGEVNNATLTVNGKTYNGSEAVDAGVQTVANGGTGVTTQADINKAFIGNLLTGESDVTDGTEFVSSYASNNGFAETANGALNKPYKRKFSAVWNYIKGKISSVLGLTKDNYGGTAATILDYNRNTPIKVRWGGAGINSAEWYPAFNADGSAIEPISRNNIRVGTADEVSSAGTSSMWIDGRAYAICKTTSAAENGGWKTLASIKTRYGSIEIGNLSGEDYIRIVYSSDADVNAKNNKVSHIMQLFGDAVSFQQKIYANSGINIPTSKPSSFENGDIWVG